MAFHSDFSGFLPSQVILRILLYYNQLQEKAVSTPFEKMEYFLVGTPEEGPGGVELKKFRLSLRNGFIHTWLVAFWAGQQQGSETAFLKPMENTTLGR